MIWLPSIDQVIEMHSILIRRTGGSDGIRDLGLIESALARASAGFGEFERYPSVEAKAAAIAPTKRPAAVAVTAISITPSFAILSSMVFFKAKACLQSG